MPKQPSEGTPPDRRSHPDIGKKPERLARHRLEERDLGERADLAETDNERHLRCLVDGRSTLYAFLYGGGLMKTMSYTESRARYAEVLDSVVNDREEVVITRAGHEPVVIMSLEDFESLRETAYLMRSPANARRLLDAMERLESGVGEAHDLVDAD